MSKVEYKYGDSVVLNTVQAYMDPGIWLKCGMEGTIVGEGALPGAYLVEFPAILSGCPRRNILLEHLSPIPAPVEEKPAPNRDLLPYQSWVLTDISTAIHQSMKDLGWWDDADNPLIISNKIALAHSELSEALEGARKDLQDDHLPQHKMLHVELADALYRILDLCGFLGIDIGEILSEKHAYNMKRADHKRENRKAEGGKKF